YHGFSLSMGMAAFYVGDPCLQSILIAKARREAGLLFVRRGGVVVFRRSGPEALAPLPRTAARTHPASQRRPEARPKRR
ncbi:MAG: hypothetical protein K0Q60_4803, partial [Microvirga sp.]|nr:hypothetical protein [Microvirga sp.]